MKQVDDPSYAYCESIGVQYAQEREPVLSWYLVGNYAPLSNIKAGSVIY